MRHQDPDFHKSENNFRQLATPLSNSGRMTRVVGNGENPAGKAVTDELGITMVAWQGEERGVPARVVVRLDGLIHNKKDLAGQLGFPCAVVRVDYAVGGLSRSVLIDAVNQSALPLWAESLEVTPIWDERRISRLASYSVAPCVAQQLAAAVSCTVVDTGEASGRYLDVLAADATTGEETPLTWSIHPIPIGARGVRFLNYIDGSSAQSSLALADLAAFVIDADAFIADPTDGLVEAIVVDPPKNSSIIHVPVDAQFLVVAIPTEDFPSSPAWLEWVIAADYGSGY